MQLFQLVNALLFVNEDLMKNFPKIIVLLEILDHEDKPVILGDFKYLYSNA